MTKHAAIPPGWISKPLRAMIPDELEDLRAALHRETPPDVALLRAVDRQLASRYIAPDPYEESDDWAWADTAVD